MLAEVGDKGTARAIHTDEFGLFDLPNPVILQPPEGFGCGHPSAMRPKASHQPGELYVNRGKVD